MSDASFLEWFQANGGSLDVSSVGINTFPLSEGGRGAVALKDIPQGHTLFTIPRFLTLSPRTSQLLSEFGEEAWRYHKLHQGWAGLILCMMWEQARGNSSKWSEYFNILPTRFDTPMFWSQIDLEELRGTSVVEKLGKDEAERDYREKLLPAMQSRPDLFPYNIAMHYSLEMYHTMGSRILSRSFDVERWHQEEEESFQGNISAGSDMDVDLPPVNREEPFGEGDHGKDSDEEDEEVSSDTTMVPMADILNARYESENAKLFYERDELKMVATKPIKSGEQIWNTYGDLPNAELLRRYGHVDILPLPHGEGNPGDVVEVRADLLVSSVLERQPETTPNSIQEKIEWWLEEGGDDVFVVEQDYVLPPTFISLIRLFIKADEWGNAQEKGKPPKPKVDAEVLALAKDVLERRLGLYPTTLEDDKVALSTDLDFNKKQAVIVRVGEKCVLTGALDKLKVQLQQEMLKSNYSQNKRKGEHDPEISTKMKKSRR